MTFPRVDIVDRAANITAMAFLAYLVGLVAAFVGVAALYGTLMKPFVVTLQEPIGSSVEQAAPETTQSTSRNPPAKQPTQRQPPPAPTVEHAREADEASQARAEAEHRRRPPRASRRSPVRTEPEGLLLRPERCWIVTDKTRNYGYYGECQ